jgi:phage terminase small subunit
MLTPKQKLFIREYCRDLNATRAAIAAGYSKNGARAQAYRLLANANISAEIAELTAKTCTKLEISAEKVLQELARLAFLDPRTNGSLRNVTELDDDTAACISGMEVQHVYQGQGVERVKIGVCRKIKFADKGANLERLGRHLELFTDKVEHSGTVEQVDLSHLSESQLAEIEKILESATPDPK